MDSKKHPTDSAADPQLSFLADAQGRLLHMRSMLPRGEQALDKGPIADIADTARQLALQADQVGLMQISAAADAVEHTADRAQTSRRLDAPEITLRLKVQLEALEEQIREDLIDHAPVTA
jgi:hypothetical protein